MNGEGLSNKTERQHTISIFNHNIGGKNMKIFTCGKKFFLSEKKFVSLQSQTLIMNSTDINARMLFLNIKKRDVYYCL